MGGEGRGGRVSEEVVGGCQRERGGRVSEEERWEGVRRREVGGCQKERGGRVSDRGIKRGGRVSEGEVGGCQIKEERWELGCQRETGGRVSQGEGRENVMGRGRLLSVLSVIVGFRRRAPSLVVPVPVTVSTNC